MNREMPKALHNINSKLLLRQFVLLALLMGFYMMAKAQEGDFDTLKGPSRKPWYLSFGLDLKYRSIKGFKNYDYEGEYFNNSNYYSDGYWQWVHKKDANKNFLDEAYFINPKLDVLLSRDRHLKFGMSYNLGYLERNYAIRIYDSINNTTYFQPVYDSYTYLAISAMVEYSYYFIKRIEKSPFVYSSLAFGYYRATDNISGPGNELFGQWRIGAGYHNKKDWMWRLYVSGDRLGYRFSQESPIYHREQNLKIDMGLIYMGFGVVKQFTLVPD